jgi:environmental stress-induced protein Ves
VQLLTESDYQQTLWKNGAGVTTDVLIRPTGATHSTFDVRVARSPITSEGPFSSFPGIDRRITLIQGARLELDFGDRISVLYPFEPLAFDSVLAPRSRLTDGAVEVINVMTRRGVWTSSVEMLAGPQCRALTTRLDDLLLIFVVRGALKARGREGAATIAGGQALLLGNDAAADVHASGEFTAISARLTRQAGASDEPNQKLG